jgi:gamma-glutamylcyclotransferase (GGCT)/AIG2-like uncharacterized protein YtfP
MTDEEGTQNLFSYGTLQDEEVQRSVFGRRLIGQPDALVGYTLALIEIADQHFASASGISQHRNLRATANPSDLVQGTVFTVTTKELEQTDNYEPSDYRRIGAQLQSGRRAWVYLSDEP